MTPKTLLRGQRVHLTALTQDDLPTIATWYQDTEFMRLLDARPANPQSTESLHTWLEEAQKASDGYLFAVRLLDNDALIGFIELDGILWTHGTAWFSIAIGLPEYREKGYGTEAARLALAFAFQELNMHRVQATVFSYNRRSMAMFERLGFQREGTFREFIHRDRERYDMLLYGILRREFEKPMAMTV
ncbi:MAG: GNAT family N-acetyltransferase [Anaerolineae bacterium]|nr:GNAT family N-acetyltransferase [Anaerolineae bacterium]